MKVYRSTLFSVGIAALLVVLALWYWRNKATETPSATSTEGTTAPAESSESHPSIAGLIMETNASAYSTGAPPTVANVPQPPPQNNTERIGEVLSAYNDVPIDFYGKLEDQFGDPVSGAEVKGSIRVISGVRRGTDWLTTASDADGLFQFHGKGQDISTLPSKKGYALASLNGGGNYSMLAPKEDRVHPDPNNPIVIKMWRLQGAEPLLVIEQHYKLPYTSEPIYFDLLVGKVVPGGGDVKLTVNRSPGVISGRNRLAWSVQIEAVGGGVMDSAGLERIIYEAPDTGYQPSMTFIFSTNVPNKWSGGFDQGLFLTSRNDQVYSKVALSFDINDAPGEPMAVGFRGIANANHSRNWEGDPNSLSTFVR
ncbi:MAG TPA: hypothetical protein VG167_15870 [Verrucomicrobiae bacterium]|nr:hypothetical protein [Verrucomicrobiae bacterium]